VGSGGSNLALLARGELSEVAVIVTLPVHTNSQYPSSQVLSETAQRHVHLVVENLRFARLGLWNQGLVENIEDILADLLELSLDLLAVIADGCDVLIGTLGLLLLLDGGDDAPGSTSSTDNVLVCDRQEISLINTQLASKLSSRR
jgi:hypothetical protein